MVSYKGLNTAIKMWGNGLPAPKGEDNEEDMTFSIEFEKGSKKAIIGYGTW